MAVPHTGMGSGPGALAPCVHGLLPLPRIRGSRAAAEGSPCAQLGSAALRAPQGPLCQGQEEEGADGALLIQTGLAGAWPEDPGRAQ